MYKEVELLIPDTEVYPKCTVEAWCGAADVADFTLTQRPTFLFAEVSSTTPLTLIVHGMLSVQHSGNRSSADRTQAQRLDELAQQEDALA